MFNVSFVAVAGIKAWPDNLLRSIQINRMSKYFKLNLKSSFSKELWRSNLLSGLFLT